MTDPPYNVAIKGKAGQIKNDDMADGDFKAFLASAYDRLIENMRDGAVIYVAHADTERLNFTREFTRAGFKLSQTLIWNKQSAVINHQDYNWKHESMLFGWKLGAAHHFSNDFTQRNLFEQDDIDFNKMKKSELVTMLDDMRANFASTVIEFDRPTISEMHPTMKPVGLVQKLIENSSKPDWLVLDTFAGSGSTLIACVNSNRRCNLMELDPKFVDVIVRRWQDYTGEKASNLAT
jgi:DNA modification methylase